MIAGVEGVLKSRGEDWVIIDVGGVSFRVHTPFTTIGMLGIPGDKVRLHTHLHVREDNLSLYGFGSVEELRLFEMLINVSGVGPRTALSLLAVLSPEKVELAIARNDVDMLSSVPGIGKKTAARLVLEFKGKFEEVGLIARVQHEDVKAALIGLGYSAAEANSAIVLLPDTQDLSLEDKIKLALQHFARSV